MGDRTVEQDRLIANASIRQTHDFNANDLIARFVELQEVV